MTLRLCFVLDPLVPPTLERRLLKSDMGSTRTSEAAALSNGWAKETVEKVVEGETVDETSAAPPPPPTAVANDDSDDVKTRL